VHEFHVHVSVDPASTLSCAGVYLLFDTVNAVVDEFTGGGGAAVPGPVTPSEDEEPPPPHASTDAEIRNAIIVLARRLPLNELGMDSSRQMSASRVAPARQRVAGSIVNGAHFGVGVAKHEAGVHPVFPAALGG
jgi:hypothetical protein